MIAQCVVVETAESRSVGMGQVLAARKPASLHAILGSCVGVALYHPRFGVGILGHVVLAQSGGRAAAPGKFADTAVPYMLDQIEQLAGSRAGILAKIAGGASMFGTTDALQIGQTNISAVEQALGKAGIRIVARDVGGNKGRRITLQCATGELLVQVAGAPLLTL